MTKRELENKLVALEMMQKRTDEKINENVETLRDIVKRFHHKDQGQTNIFIESLMFDCDEFLFNRTVMIHKTITGKESGEYLFELQNKKRVDESIVKVVNYLESKGDDTFDSFLEFLVEKVIPAFIVGDDLPWFHF